MPKKCLIDAGIYFLSKQNRTTGLSEEELIEIAILSLGLNQISSFDPKKKIIEYAMEPESKKLVDLSFKNLTREIASDSPAPGGGSVSAAVGALGVSLGNMVANLSANKKGWDDKVSFFNGYSVQLQLILRKLTELVDEDTLAYNQVMAAYGLPNKTEDDKKIRVSSIEEANMSASLIPLKIMETAVSAYQYMQVMADKGNPNSITDVGVGILCLDACVHGAAMNVKINIKSIDSQEFRSNVLSKVVHLLEENFMQKETILQIVNSKI